MSRDGIIRKVRGSSGSRVQLPMSEGDSTQRASEPNRSMSEWLSVGGETEEFGSHSTSGGL